jgi:TctA family transporter
VDTVAFLLQGLAQALTPQNLAFALIGSVVAK